MHRCVCMHGCVCVYCTVDHRHSPTIPPHPCIFTRVHRHHPPFTHPHQPPTHSTCVTLETREKHFKKVPEGMDPSLGIQDAYVTIRNSELLTGRLGKGVLGSGNKAGLFQVLATDFSPEAAAVCMGRLAKFAARFIGNWGFSIGIDDVTPTPAFNKQKRQLLLDGYVLGGGGVGGWWGVRCGGKAVFFFVACKHPCTSTHAKTHTCKPTHI